MHQLHGNLISSDTQLEQLEYQWLLIDDNDDYDDGGDDGDYINFGDIDGD